MLTLHRPTHVLVAGLALGLCADYLFYGRLIGISAPLFVALGLAALAGLSVAERRMPNRSNLWLAAAALFFALCLAWRASATLTALNLLAALGLLALLAISYRGVALVQLPLAQMLTQLVAGLGDMAFQPGALAVHAARGSAAPTVWRYRARFRPIGCGLLLALPMLLVFTLLLMSADEVFASYVEQLFSPKFPFDFEELIAHGIFIMAIAWACSGGLLVALLGEAYSAFGRGFAALASGLIGLVSVEPHAIHGEELPAEGDTRPLRVPRQAPISLGWVESLTVLVTVDLLFGSFMAIQGAYFFGGLDTLERTGMTYSEYARRGFFELLAVACLSLALLCTLSIVTRRAEIRQRRAFGGACALMIALVLGLLASAFQRMQLYEQAYGYTELRVYTHSFMIWLALVLALFLLALLRAKPQLFTFGGFASALIYLAVLNIANPDALIVRENIGRLSAPQIQVPRTYEQVDAEYLTQLSADATPALAAALAQLDDASRQIVIQALAQQYEQLATQQQENGWPSWHVGRAAAVWAIERAVVADQMTR
jgi:Domain of unknown function (DUF4153)